MRLVGLRYTEQPSTMDCMNAPSELGRLNLITHQCNTGTCIGMAKPLCDAMDSSLYLYNACDVVRIYLLLIEGQHCYLMLIV